MKYYLNILILCVLYPCCLYGQICDGSLGENIFESGDFGSGTMNVFPNDPNISTEYNYTTLVPPYEGFYTWTNDTDVWALLFFNWIPLEDNSADPNGYMMVVNASYESSIFYEQEVFGFCENTRYEFSADIFNLVRIEVTDPEHIKPDVSFLLNGIDEYTTGEIPQNGMWNTYGFTFTTEPGQTSITLSMRNNAPSGLGNDFALDNISFRACGPLAQILPDTLEYFCQEEEPIEIASMVTGEQFDSLVFQWQQSFDGGITWENISGATEPNYSHLSQGSGIFYYRFLLAGGEISINNPNCWIISNTKVIEILPRFWNIADTICEGQVYFQGDNSAYTQSGTYTDTLFSSFDCDSIVILDLTVVPDMGIDATLFSQSSPCPEDMEGGSIEIENISGGYPPYNLFLNGDTIGNIGTITNLEPDDYEISIVDQFGCSFETEVTIEAPIPFVIDLGPDWSIELGAAVQIEAIVNDEVISTTWSTDILDCDDVCLDVEFFPGNTQYYFLSAISDDNCITTDSVFIEVEKVRKVFIPNIFSPNFDGTNDYFIPYAAIPNVQAIRRMQIFNRWGAVVYEQQNFQPNQFDAGWDGTLKGKAAEMGIYVYLIEVLFLDGVVETYSGDLTLVR